MTTPSLNTPYGIIKDAMFDAGKLQLGDDPTPDQIAQYMGRLNDLVNYFMTKGIKLWLLSDTSVTIVAGQNQYTFKPSGDVNMTKPLRVIDGYFLYSSNNSKRQLTALAWEDFQRLSGVGTLSSNQGTISCYFVDKQATELDVTFWLCPDATEVANGKPHVLLQTQATNPTTLTETMDFPAEWRIALRWNLAWEICTGQPQAVIDRCKEMATVYRMELENWDVEDAPTRFTVNTQFQNRSEFR